MLIAFAGDRSWKCDEMAVRCLSGLAESCGPSLWVILAEGTGVPESFLLAVAVVGGVNLIEADEDVLDPHLHDPRYRPDFLIVAHRYLPGSTATRELAIRAIAAGVTTCLIEDESGDARSIRADDYRLQPSRAARARAALAGVGPGSRSADRPGIAPRGVQGPNPGRKGVVR